jgi:hypothetical protein
MIRKNMTQRLMTRRSQTARNMLHRPVDVVSALTQMYWWSPAFAAGDGQSLIGQGLAAAIPLQLGSAVGADTNDPYILPHSGTTYVQFPGVASNYGSAGLAIGAITSSAVFMVYGRVYHATWRPTAAEAPLGGASTHNMLMIQPTGQISTTLVSPSAVVSNVGSSVNIAAGEAIRWIAFDFRETDGRVRFFYSDQQTNDPTQVIWVQLGTDMVASFTGDRNAAGHMAVVGGSNTTGGSPFNGRIYYAGWSADGVAVYGVDLTRNDLYNATQTQITPVIGSVALIFNRPANGRKLVVVNKPRALFGTDDYMTTPDVADLDFALADSFTVLLALRRYGTPVSNQVLVAKKTAAGLSTGWGIVYLTTDSYRFEIADTATNFTNATVAAPAHGTLTVVTARRNVATDQIQISANAVHGAPVADASNNTLANAESMRVGRYSGAGTNYGDFELVKLAVARRYLTDVEVAAIQAEMVA